MTNENKDKIIDRVIDFLHNKPLKNDMRIAAALIEELKLLKNCSIPDVVGRSEQLKAFADYVQGRMWEGEDKDLSEFVEEFLSL